ncbi:serine/threonine protein kinases, putative [Microscilla marina ATCC 23134]|uniref:Serine/threonine protein kinases, putative n=1 Tax=Microscilla marina ATCC 23134 TaxID=313606 RepID=A1ZXA1_MICM2|nr:serine/threonine protein kinases, putative [Microscilla marina ATCC 23134]
MLAASKPDTQRVNLLIALGKAHIRISSDTLKNLGEAARQLAQKINFKRGIGEATNNIGISYYFKGNYPKAIEHYQKALKIFQSVQSLRGISSIYNNLGIIQRRQGNNIKALEYYQKALSIQEKLKDTRLMSFSYNNIGTIALHQKEYDKALENYQKSLELKKVLGSAKGVATAYNNMGRVYELKKEYELALSYYKKALHLYNTSNLRIAPYYSNVGNALMHLNRLDSALIYHQRGLDKAIEAKATRYQTMALIGLANVYYRKGEYNQAIEAGKKAVGIAKKMKVTDFVRDANQVLYQSHEKLKNYERAFKYHREYVMAKDTLFNESRTKDITRLELNYTFDKKQALIKAKQKAKEERLKIENEKRLAQQRLYLFSVLGILFTVVLFSFFVFRSRQVQKKLNSQLTIQKNDLQQKRNELVTLNEELHQSRDEIIAQRDYIETQHKDLTMNKERIDSSIRAAQTIQQAVLPFAKELQELFTDYFVLYRPKDVVSGDFYWVKQLSEQTIVVVADCTGHGVPGAFMSLIGVNLLDKIIFQENISQPAKILDRLHFLMNVALRQQDSERRQGGMDAVIFSLAPQTDHHTKVIFSGARNPLYYKVAYQPGVQLLKGDRKSIGGMRNDAEQFTAQELTLPQGSVLYAGSDGLQDQNNVVRKKFGSKRLLKLLNIIVTKPMNEQRELLESELQDHMQGTVQRDDILWVGVKV